VQKQTSYITNLLLLGVLAVILIVSGSLQRDMGNLTRLDDSFRPAVRVDGCHFVFSEPAQAVSCPNKACHHGNLGDHSFGGPEYQNQQPLNLPLASSSHSDPPECKTGEPFKSPNSYRQPILAVNSNHLLAPFQSQRELRTTVLLN